MHTTIRIISLKILMMLLFIDFSGDYMLIQELGPMPFLNGLIRNGIIGSLIFCSFQGALDLFRVRFVNYNAIYPAFTLLIVLIYGLLWGCLGNQSAYAMRETICMAPIFIIPSFLLLAHHERAEFARFICNLLATVCFIKILLAQGLRLYFWGDVSWKVLLRETPLLIFPYLYYMFKIIDKETTKKNIFIIMIIIIEILAGEARTLNFTIIAVTMFFMMSSSSPVKAFKLLAVFFIAILVASLVTGNELKNILGYWSGVHYENSADYRVIQLGILKERFISQPLSGFGFGYFTPGYNGYEDLDLPYLLELDLLNFASKVGLPLFILYISGYFAFALRYWRIRNCGLPDKNLYCALMVSMFAMLFYSCYQTLHSSVLYWSIYALCFGLLYDIPPQTPAFDQVNK